GGTAGGGGRLSEPTEPGQRDRAIGEDESVVAESSASLGPQLRIAPTQPLGLVAHRDGFAQLPCNLKCEAERSSGDELQEGILRLVGQAAALAQVREGLVHHAG